MLFQGRIVLEASALECVRGERTLFRNVGFRLEGGTLLHVAGANGSGKTSLLRIVCGLSTPERGDVRWRGETIRKVREEYGRHLIYVGHANALKDDLTALENLEFAGALAGTGVASREVATALEQFGVAHCAHLPARVLSQGQRRRVSLARLALSTRAQLWVLDEPFSALDAGAVECLQHMITAQLAAGGAVVFTTHQEVAVAAAVRITVRLGA
jgi:heme exporter protein A